MSGLWAGGGRYDAWARFLERWAAGETSTDPATLPAVEREHFQGDTWERLVNRLTDALSARLGTWARMLTRSVSAAGTEFEVARALTQARQGLHPIRAVAAHPGLPEDLRTGLADLVDRQIGTAQQQLEEQVERLRRSGADHTAVEERLRTIRHNSLLSITAPTPQVPRPSTVDGWLVDPGARPRRHVITD